MSARRALLPVLAILASLAALVLSAGAPAPAWAQNSQASGLPARTSPAASDIVPCQPAGSTLKGCTAGAIAALGGGGGGVSLNGFAGVDPTGNPAAAPANTAAIQAALNTGQSLSCDGLYAINAGFTQTTSANHGQQVVGVGPTSSLGTPTTNRCVFQPVAGFTGFVFTVDGTPTTQYVTGWGFENITVDLVNVADAATNGAFHTVQAFDGHYTNVRVINDGNYKRALLEGPASGAGATFTTLLSNFQGNWVDLQGQSAFYETTTTTLINPDIGRITTNYAGITTLVGGAVQFGYTAGVTPVIWVAAGLPGPYSLGGTSTGYYLAYATDLKNTQFFHVYNTDFEAANQPPHTCTSGSYSGGTYNDGTHGCAPIYMSMYIEPTAFGTVFSAASPAGMYVYDLGVGTDLPNLSQNGVYAFAVHNFGATYDLGDLRVTGNVEGPIAFGGALGTETGYTYSINGSTGAATFRSLNVQPATDGGVMGWRNAAGATVAYFSTYGGIGNMVLAGPYDGYQFVARPGTDGSVLVLENAAGTSFMICASNATVGSSNCGVGEGADWAGFSDGYVTQTYDLDSAGGNARFTGTMGAYALSISAAPFSALKTIISAALPTYSSGFSTGTPTIAGASTSAFTVTLGATPGSVGVLTMPAAATGWVCLASDQTTGAGTIRETASTTNSVTFALSGTVAGDVLNNQCMGR